MNNIFFKINLGKIGKTVTGKTPLTSKKEYFLNRDYMFITPEDITNSPAIISSTKRYISIDGFKSIKSNTVSGESILVGCIGSDMGNVGYVNKPCATNQQINTITDINQFLYYPKYIYYYLKLLKKFFRQTAGVTTTPILPKSVFDEIKINIQDLPNQKKIANFLYGIDSKIELNNKINTELESMAKTLYDYWFIQFDFPDRGGKPYKSNGGKMVWNKELKKEIPDKWEVKKMNQLLIKNTEKFNLNTINHNLDTIDLSVMPSSTMCLNEKSYSSSFDTNLFKLNKFDILFGGIRPYLLKAGFSPFDGLVTGTVHSFKVNNQNEYNFSLITMVHNSMFKFAVSNSKGTKMPVIGTDDLLCYKVAYNKEILRKFNELISFKEEIAHNIVENQKLIELRDWLLPMLMNGQVTVN